MTVLLLPSHLMQSVKINNKKDIDNVKEGSKRTVPVFLLGGDKMNKCKDCGLLMSEGNDFKCYRYQTDLTETEIIRERDCLFFTEPIYDDGEPMPPAQLVLIKELDIKSRKMQGPV